MTLTIVPAEYHHIAPIAIHMRQADRDEIAALAELAPFSALEMCLLSSRPLAWTVLIDDVPAGMFGCGTLPNGDGQPWLLGTDALEANKAAVARASVYWRGQLLQRYRKLTNLIDARNTVTIRWLKWLGFSISEPFEAGPNNHLFRKFEMRQRVLLCA